MSSVKCTSFHPKIHPFQSHPLIASIQRWFLCTCTGPVYTSRPSAIWIIQIQILTITTQVTLNEDIVVGSRLRLSVTLEGIIPIKIPCLDIGGTNLGSWCQHDLSLSPYLFSEYDVDELLGMVAVTGICEDYIPEGQACNLPLGPGSSHDLFCLSIFLSSILAEISSWWKGVYGSGEPLVIPFSDVPDILAPFLKVFIPRSFPFIRAIFLITMMMAIQIFFDDQSWSPPGRDKSRGDLLSSSSSSSPSSPSSSPSSSSSSLSSSPSSGCDKSRGDFLNSVRRQLWLRLDQGCCRPLNVTICWNLN